MSSGASITADVKDIEKTIKMLNKAGKSPQKAVTRAAGRAGTVLKRKIKQGEVPRKTGTLRKSIIRVGEKTKKRGKKVYEATFDRKMNDQLQKPIKQRGALGGKSGKAYYPASMEYGFLARAKDGSGGVVYFNEGVNDFRSRPDAVPSGVSTQKVEGHHFMQKGAAAADSEVRQILVDKTMEELEKIWQSTQ